MEENLINQEELANSLSEKIPYEFERHFLVKPLEPTMVEKKFTEMVPSDNAPKTDENDIEAVDYDVTKEEIKTVESDWKKGVVLKIPAIHKDSIWSEKYKSFYLDVKVGDVIVYNTRAGKWFDLFKDSEIVAPYDVLAKVTNVDK